MKKPHYAWWVCLSCALIIFCTSGLSINAFSIYQPYIIRQNGFTNTQSSAILTVRSLTSFLSMFLTGAYYRRFSLRTGLGLAGGMTAAGFALFGLAGSFPLYCAASAVLGLGYGLGTMIPIAMLMERWFSRKRALALGLCSSVTGLSTLGIPTLLVRLVESRGLSRTFLLEAGAVALLVFLAFLPLRSDPAELGLEPYGGAAAGNGDERGVRSGKLERRDWLFIVPMLLLIGAVTTVGYSHLSVLMTSNGFSVEITALAIAVSGVLLTLGKCLFGFACDKLTVPRCNVLFGAAVIAGLVTLCAMGSNRLLLFFGVVLYSAGLAVSTVGLTTWAGDWSAPEQYDATVRRFQIGYAAGGLVFSTLPGILADRAAGSYTPAYVFFCVCEIAVLVTAQSIYARQRRGSERRSGAGVPGRALRFHRSHS